MRVACYEIDQRTGESIFYAAGELSEFLSDPDPELGLAETLAALEAQGEAMYGGGASPLYRFERIPLAVSELEALLLGVE